MIKSNNYGRILEVETQKKKKKTKKGQFFIFPKIIFSKGECYFFKQLEFKVFVFNH